MAPDAPLRLLGDRTPAAFLRDYWQKRPLVVRDALPDFVSPLAPEELAGLACEAGVEGRIVLEEGGAHPWELREGPFAEDDFTSLPATHWTLLVQAVDDLVPAVAALLDRFAFLPKWRLDDVMVSYAPSGGGVGAHIDRYDVFLVQGLGHRRWHIGHAPVEDETIREGLDVRILADFTPDETVDLGPGDLLYLPPRVAHHGVALDDRCMTYSVGLRAPSHADLVADFLGDTLDRLGEDDRYADPDLAPAEHAGALRPDAVARVRRFFRGLVDDEAALADWMGRFVTRPSRGYPHPRAEPLTPADASEALAAGAGLRRGVHARLAYVARADGGATLYAGGDAHALAPPLAYAAPLLTDREAVPADALAPHHADDAFCALVAALVNDGLLELVGA
jgi:50S ribosomal protein L16 3-hydroxylase